MRGSLLGLAFGVLFVATTSCGKDESPSEDNDAGAGGQDAGAGRGGARAGRGGTAGSGTAGNTSGGGGRGGNANGGSGGGSGGGDAGGSDAGESGAGGATEGGSAGTGGGNAGAGGSAGTLGGGAGKAGSGGNAGKAGGGAGSGGSAGKAGGGAGSGGSAGSATGCERTPQGAVLVDADFSTDIFASSAWTRSDTSVSLTGGIVTIGADTEWDDYIRVAPPSATLPLVVELRQRTIESTPHTEVVPVNEIHFGDITLGVAYATDLGWLFSTSSTYSGSQINAPLQGEWITMRAYLGINASELCAKKDGQAAFTRVATSGNFRLPAVLQDVHVRQAWDYRYEMSDLRIQRP